MTHNISTPPLGAKRRFACEEPLNFSTPHPLTWVRGNDVNLTLWLYENAAEDNNELKRTPFDFLACESIEVALVSPLGTVPLQHAAAQDDNALVIRIPHTLPAGSYAIELKAVRAEAHIRSFECGAVRVVNSNDKTRPLGPRVAGLRTTAYDVELLLTPAPPLRPLNPWEAYRKENPSATFDDFLRHVQSSTLNDIYDTSLGILKRESFYDDGSHLLVPLTPPRYASQPSILPQKFGNRYVYQQVFFPGQGEWSRSLLTHSYAEFFTLTGGNTPGKILIGIKGMIKDAYDHQLPLLKDSRCNISLSGNTLRISVNDSDNTDFMIIVEYCDDHDTAPYYDSYSSYSSYPSYDSYPVIPTVSGAFRGIGSPDSNTYAVPFTPLSDDLLAQMEKISFTLHSSERDLTFTYNDGSWSIPYVHANFYYIDSEFRIFYSSTKMGDINNIISITLFFDGKPVETFNNIDFNAS